MPAKKPVPVRSTPWKVTSTGESIGQEAAFTNPREAEKFWADLCDMYPEEIHSLWLNDRLIKHN